MIHQYKNNGYNIVLDVYSGAVHVVDDLCYDVIEVLNSGEAEPTTESLASEETKKDILDKLSDRYEEADLLDALADVTELAGQRTLFSKDIYEGMVDVVKKQKTVVKALCLHIAHDCNLACKYCFAE